MSGDDVRAFLQTVKFDCITLAEYNAARGELTRAPMRIEVRTLDERREARWGDPANGAHEVRNAV